MRFDSVDRQILAALDDGFIIDDNNEVASISGPITITVTRVGDDQLELVIAFANIEFPILMAKSQTLKSLHIADDS